MAGPSFVESLPPAQAEIVNGILERLPPAQRPEALRVCRTITERCGEIAPEALRRFNAIVSNERFTQSMLGTVSLIATRAGSNVVSTLNAFERLLSSDKFNRHIHEAARLSVIRAGADSNEALNALYNLVDNPSFSTASLNIALPDRFLRFLDVAIRAGADQAYLSIRALGSLFCNAHFSPANLNPGFAATFSRWMSAVREAGNVNRLDAIESFSTILANSAVNPQRITEETARSAASLTNLVIEYTRPYEDVGRNAPTIEGVLRTFRLILGHRSFSLDMLQQYSASSMPSAVSGPGAGLLAVLLNTTSLNMQDGLSEFLAFMRATRREVGIFAIAGGFISEGNPINRLRLLSSIVSNPSLVRLIDDRDFPATLTRIASALSLNNSETPLTTLAEIAADPRMDARAWARTLAMVESIRSGYAPAALNILHQYLRIPGRAFPTDAELSIITSFTGRLADFFEESHPGGTAPAGAEESAADASRMIQHPVLSAPGTIQKSVFWLASTLGGAVSSPGFRIGMLEEGGLLSAMIRRCGPDEVDLATSRLSEIMSRDRYHPDLEPFLMELVDASIRTSGSVTHRSVSVNLNFFWELFGSPHFDRRLIPALREEIHAHPNNAGALMSLWVSILHNPQYRTSLRSRSFVRRVGGLVSGMGRGTDREGILDSVTTLLSDPSLTRYPQVLRSIEALMQMAGPGSGPVLRALIAANDSVPAPTLFSWRNVEFLASIVLSAPPEARDAVGDALGAVLRSPYASLAADETVRSRIIRSFRAFLQGAGPQAGIAAAGFIPMLEIMLADQGPIPSLLYQRFIPSNTERMGQWVRAYLESFPAGQRQTAAEGLSGLGTMFSSRGLYDMMMDSPEQFLRGQALARRLIGGMVPPDVCFNFAYAIEAIGEERAELLYRRFGIRYFARYSEEMLERLHERATGASTRPVALAVYPHNDWNGAFYHEGRRLDGLLDRYDVIIYERDSEQGFFGALSDFGRRFGRTRTMIIAGHGSPDSIRFGDETDAGMLDLTDSEQLPAIRSVLSNNPTVILQSCSTGKDEQAIGGVLSRVLRARLFAPVDPGNVSSFDIDSDGNVSAEYNVETGYFSAGRRARRH